MTFYDHQFEFCLINIKNKKKIHQCCFCQLPLNGKCDHPFIDHQYSKWIQSCPVLGNAKCTHFFHYCCFIDNQKYKRFFMNQCDFCGFIKTKSKMLNEIASFTS